MDVRGGSWKGRSVRDLWRLGVGDASVARLGELLDSVGSVHKARPSLGLITGLLVGWQRQGLITMHVCGGLVALLGCC